MVCGVWEAIVSCICYGVGVGDAVYLGTTKEYYIRVFLLKLFNTTFCGWITSIECGKAKVLSLHTVQQ